MIPLLGVLVGAIMSGGVQVVLKRMDRRHLREVILRAVAAEVGVICVFIRSQRYVERYAEQAAISRDGGVGSMIPLDATQSYMIMYDKIANDIGLLSQRQIEVIATFYMIAKIAIDTSRSGSRYAHGGENNLRFMSSLAAQMLALGAIIACFPKHPITYQASE